MVQYVNHGYQHTGPQRQGTLVPYQPPVQSTPNVQYVTPAAGTPYMVSPTPQPPQQVMYVTTPAQPGQTIPQGYTLPVQTAQNMAPYLQPGR